MMNSEISLERAYPGSSSRHDEANPSISRRTFLSYQRRFEGLEDKSCEFFYGSVLSAGPITWIDRVQIKCPVESLKLDCALFSGFQSKHYIAILPRDRSPENAIVKTGYCNKIRHLYIDLTLIEFAKPVYLSFVHILVELLSAKVILNNRHSMRGLKEEAVKLLALFVVNEIELRTDIAFDIGGLYLLTALAKYFQKRHTDDKKSNATEAMPTSDKGENTFLLDISSWTNRHKRGYLVKAYERPKFARVEIVFYASIFSSSSVREVLCRPVKMIATLQPYSILLIKRLAKQKAGLYAALPYIYNAENLETRCVELGIAQLAYAMMREGQSNGVF